MRIFQATTPSARNRKSLAIKEISPANQPWRLLGQIPIPRNRLGNPLTPLNAAEVPCVYGVVRHGTLGAFRVPPDVASSLTGIETDRLLGDVTAAGSRRSAVRRGLAGDGEVVRAGWASGIEGAPRPLS